ncbi:hypothetical protein CR513_39731, partial [Mucuna pruriens]
MRPQGILEDYIKMKVFPFSLDRAAKDWLYLQPVLFNTWGDMKCMFLEKFFLVSRTTTIRKEIYGIRQHSRETLHEFHDDGPKHAIGQLAIGQHQPVIVAKVCGICTSVEHPIDMCPTLQETESDHLESVGSIGGYQYGKQSYQKINIYLLDAIKQILKYAKFLKELYVHKRKKMKGEVELGGIISTLTRNEVVVRSKLTLPKKCQDPRIFSIPCTISVCTFVDAMLDLKASINVMPTSIYKSLKFGDLEPIGMTIQLANRSIVQPLGVLDDVLVQVNELIFPTDFYVLDMEDETSRKGFTLILG